MKIGSAEILNEWYYSISFPDVDTEAERSLYLEATQLNGRASSIKQVCLNKAHSFFFFFKVPPFYFGVKSIKKATICYHHHCIK